MQLTQEHTELKRTVEKFVEDRLNPFCDEWEQNAPFPAKEVFPELSDKLKYLDITQDQPRDAQVTVVSATLEHVISLMPGLKHVLESTNELVILRAFLGDQTFSEEYQHQGAELPYPVNQYSFKDIFEAFDQYGFSAQVIRDQYTDSMPKHIGGGIVRTHYIVVGRKKDVNS